MEVKNQLIIAEPIQERILEEDTALVVKNTLARAASLNKRLPHPLFTGDLGKLEEMTGGQGFFHPETGMVGPDVQVTSNRNTWDRMDHLGFHLSDGSYKGLPRVQGSTSQGKRIFNIGRNSVAGTDFDHRLLKGADPLAKVVLDENGDLKIQNPGEPDKPLTDAQLRELQAIFRDADLKLKEREKLVTSEAPIRSHPELTY